MIEMKKIRLQEIYKNKWLTLKEDIIVRNNGQEGVFSVVEKEDFVVILPIDDNFIYVVEQYRYPVKEKTLEVPQGSFESVLDNDLEDAAKRELQEETGLRAGKMTYIGYQFLATGFCNQGFKIFVASDLEQGNSCLDDEGEDLITKKMKITDFEKCILNDEIKDSTTTIAYLLAKLKGYIKL